VGKKLEFQLTMPNVLKSPTYSMMTNNGEKIWNYLENATYELSLGCTYNGHRYSQKGNISCVICGKTE
jgi:hypothetical protein